MDSYAGAFVESGDVLRSNCKIKAELGEVIAGSKEGRQNHENITIYKSLGLAVQDLAAAKLISDISHSSNFELPVKQIKTTDIITYDHFEYADGKHVTTTCQSTPFTFTSKAHFNPTYNFISCEVTMIGNFDGSVCSSVCFLYNAENGKLISFVSDWDYNASNNTKMNRLASLVRETTTV